MNPTHGEGTSILLKLDCARLMKLVTSTIIFLSALLQAVLKRLCRLTGRSMLNRRIGSALSAFTGSAFPLLGKCVGPYQQIVNLQVRRFMRCFIQLNTGIHLHATPDD